MTNKITPQQFRQLATLIESGSDIIKALDILNEQSPCGTLQTLIRRLQRGSSLSVALNNERLTGIYERTLLEVAQHSGKLSNALNEIANFHESRQQRVQRLKKQLWLSITIVSIAVVIGTALDVARGHPPLTSVLSNALVLVLILVVNQCLFSLLQRDIFSWLSTGWGIGLQKSVSLYQRYFEFYFYTLLNWQIEAGNDLQSAFNKCSTILANKSYQKKIKNCLQQIQQGQGIADILRQNDLVFSTGLNQTLITGEQSGSLHQAISHYLRLERESLEATTDAIFRWLPRIYYILVLSFVLQYVF